ncbi:MAG: dihydroneopterin aldolase [Dinghuibacter sp.]|nr:dihydroneopterin aldolase [Dinghuibacter sp.]
MHYTVHLENIRLFGRHGVYAAEQQTGGMFLLNIHCGFTHGDMITQLAETVNYEAVYQMVQQIFETPRALLETLAGEMAAAIYSAYPFLHEISITIKKLNPPIASFAGTTGVTFTRQYS